MKFFKVKKLSKKKSATINKNGAIITFFPIIKDSNSKIELKTLSIVEMAMQTQIFLKTRDKIVLEYETR